MTGVGEPMTLLPVGHFAMWTFVFGLISIFVYYLFEGW